MFRFAIPLLLSLAGCPPATDGGPGDGAPEICGNGVDDDGDGGTDCADEDCAGFCPEICGDLVDNDSDGSADCLDEDCDGSCAEACDDGRDNDGDGGVDCADADCNGPACPEDCGDGRDNDGDGASDCSDVDCTLPTCDELCTDARDNDGDGLADCDDPDCDGSCPENCTDTRDNDADGLADCDDPQCEADCPEDCLDFIDNDADGLTDCVDPECDAQCDADGDGFLNGDHGGDDCDDNNPEVNPEGNEACNGFDDDCNGLVDLDDAGLDVSTLLRFYPDEDGDGFGNRQAGGVWACEAEEGLVADDKDCDDDDATVNPSALEICNDIDDDCDALTDDADPSVDLATAPTFWLDSDSDGWGDAAFPLVSCHSPPGYVDNDLDCDDSDGGVGGALLDWYADDDGDGHGAGAVVETACIPSDLTLVYSSDDCNDDDDTVYPEAPEPCDLVDNDCDALLDWDDDSNQCTISGDDIGATIQEVTAVLGPDDIGFGTAIEGDGSWIAIGIPDGADDDAGLVQLFDGSTGSWLLGPSFDGGLAFVADGFGSALALESDLLVVGAPEAGVGGRMYAWERDPVSGVWEALPTWEPADAEAGQRVGASVGIANGRVLVGAPGRDDAGTDAGAVFVLLWDGAAWTEDLVFEGDAAFLGLGGLLDADGDWAVTAQVDEVCFLDIAGAAMDCALGTPGLSDVTVAGDRAAVAALAAVDVYERLGATWTLADVLVPHVLPVDGYATAVDLESDLLVVGSPNADDPAAHVWKKIGGVWVEAAWIEGAGGLPSDTLLVQGPAVYKASNCIPFGDGVNYDPYMGFIYKNLPAFELRSGDTLAFDLWAQNDVDIDMNIAMAHTTVDGGNIEDAVGFVPVASGKPAAPRGNANFLDYELLWEIDNSFSFPGGGLIVRFRPVGGFAADASCTGVVSTCDSTDPSGKFVHRFYNDTDGISPWTGWDTVVIGVMRITTSSAPTFGSAVLVEDANVWIGAPGDPLDPAPGSASVCEPTDEAPAW